LYRVQASKWVSVKTDFVAKFYKKILIELKDAKKKKETDPAVFYIARNFV
jgi:hypothetical protein